MKVSNKPVPNKIWSVLAISEDYVIGRTQRNKKFQMKVSVLQLFTESKVSKYVKSLFYEVDNI